MRNPSPRRGDCGLSYPFKWRPSGLSLLGRAIFWTLFWTPLLGVICPIVGFFLWRRHRRHEEFYNVEDESEEAIAGMYLGHRLEDSRRPNPKGHHYAF
jgi:hypothetical protein